MLHRSRNFVFLRRLRVSPIAQQTGQVSTLKRLTSHQRHWERIQKELRLRSSLSVSMDGALFRNNKAYAWRNDLTNFNKGKVKWWKTLTGTQVFVFQKLFHQAQTSYFGRVLLLYACWKIAYVCLGLELDKWICSQQAVCKNEIIYLLCKIFIKNFRTTFQFFFP